jgi:hypothetical protein
VPIPPELVALLRAHVRRFGLGPQERLFRSENGGPVQDTAYGDVWRKARKAALTAEPVDSPLDGMGVGLGPHTCERGLPTGVGPGR